MFRKKSLLTAALATVGMMLAGTSADAALITIDPVTGVSVSSEEAGIDRIGDHVVNGNGLTGGTHTNENGDGTMWLIDSGTPQSVENFDSWIEFDLGAVYTIDSFRVWNLNHSVNTDRGVKGVSVQYGSAPAPTTVLAGVTEFAEASGLATYEGELFDGSDFTPFDARYIRFEIDDTSQSTVNYGDDDYVGLSEVQFFGTLVPEPSSLALLGLGGLCLVKRRRRG